ncbi:MAG TPA: AMP-binding protein [Chthoniobacterales bacterium]|nr:AMP-binding protein [Chthoniobacterales bacterium]
MRLLCCLKSLIVAPQHLVFLGSLADFAGPKISQLFRRVLFRVFGAALSADFYRYRTEMERIRALFTGFASGALSRVRTHGLEHLPKEGFLLVSNHTAGFDAVALQLACPRPIRFLVLESACQHQWLNPILALVGTEAIPISRDRAKNAVAKAVEYIQNGEIVCVFPEGQLNSTSSLLRLHRGFELIARLAGCEIVPVWIDSPETPTAYRKDGQYFFKPPKRIARSVAVAFGRPMPGRSVGIGLVREKLLELGESCFRRQDRLNVHLARATIEGIKHSQSVDIIIDGNCDRRLKRIDLLAVSIALASWIKKNCEGERVAVLLPPGINALIANVAITFANKVPVNFDLADQNAVLRATIAQGQIQRAILSESTIMCREDSSKGVYRLEELFVELRTKIRFWRIWCFISPAWLLSNILGLPRNGGRKGAVIVFPNNSSEAATGIELSHRNVMANVMQLDSTLKMGRKDSLMTTPVFFYSSGCALSVWYPLIKGIPTLTYSETGSPEKSAELIERYQITSLIATPGLLSGYLRCAPARRLKSVKIIICGSGGLRSSLDKGFKRKFGRQIFEGYWHTETGLFVSTNLPSPTPQQLASRWGSVGKPLRGQVAQIRHPETGEVLSSHQTGMLWLKGAHIFAGHLSNPGESAERSTDGWFRTGDLARFDEDGFLYIERPV